VLRHRAILVADIDAAQVMAVALIVKLHFMFDVRRLQALHAVATHGTVGRAATALSFTPSAVSQQLAALERDAGCQLLARKGRGVELTESGRLLAAHAATILDQMTAARATLEQRRGEVAGVVRVAAFPSALATIVAAALPVLRQRAPDVAVSIVEAEPDVALRLAAAGDADLVVAHSYDLVPRQLPAAAHVTHIADDEMVLALPIDHPDAAGTRDAHRPVPLAALDGQAWITPGATTSCFEYVQRACGAAGFVPDVVAMCTDHAAVLALVAAGTGVALLPDRAVADGVPPGVTVRSTSPSHRRHVHAVTLATPSTATATVLDLLVEVAGRR